MPQPAPLGAFLVWFDSWGFGRDTPRLAVMSIAATSVASYLAKKNHKRENYISGATTLLSALDLQGMLPMSFIMGRKR